MANYAVLKAAVQAVVKTNGNQEITGANMQSTLISIINSLGTGYQFMGVATPSTSPGTPDYNVAYIGGAGTYANFGTSVTVPMGSICVFKYNGSWVKEQIDDVASSVFPYTQNGFLGVKKGTQLPIFPTSPYSAPLTPAEFSQFFLDMKLYGTPEAGTEYRFRNFHHRTQSGGNSYVNYIVVSKSSDNWATNTNVVTGIIGSLPPSGIVLHEFTPTNSTLTKIKLLLNWDALSHLDGSGFPNASSYADYNVPVEYKQEMSYLTNLNYGIIPQYEASQKTLYIDDTPTEDSNNLVKSGGVYETFEEFDGKITIPVEILDSSSQYLINTMDNAWMQNGSIVRNQYTTPYHVLLFRLPAGVYLARPKYATSASVIYVGTIASESDFVVGGTISNVLVKGNDTGNIAKEFDNETLVCLATNNSNVLCELYIGGYPASCIENLNKKIENTSAYTQNGLLGVKKGTALPNFVKGFYGYPLTPAMFSSFFLDMKLYGTPEANTEYRFRNFHHRTEAGGNSYVNYIVVSKSSDNWATYTDVVLGIIGSLPPSGIVLHEFTPTNSTLTKIKLLLNWDALAHLDGSGFATAESYADYNVPIEYKQEMSYLTNLGYGLIPVYDAKNDIDEIKGEIGGTIDIDIPPVVYAIAGTELNLWNDAIALSSDRGLQSPLNYQVRWECNKGTVTDRCFRYTPTDADAGNDYTCRVYVYNNNFVEIAIKVFTIRVKAKNALSASKKIAFFGDSLGASSATALYSKFQDTDRFTGTAPTMVGTRGTTPKYDAVGGFTWNSYATAGFYAYRVSVTGVTSVSIGTKYSLTISGTAKTLTVIEVNITSGTGNLLFEADYGARVSNFPATGTLTYVSGSGDPTISFTNGFEESGNPLWNDQTQQLDVSQYKTLCGLQSSDKIDAVAFQFGINDAFSEAAITNNIVALYNAFIADNSSCKFIIAIPPTSGNDANGWGANYGAGGNGTIAYKQKMEKFRQLYLSLASSGNYPNMRLATGGLEVDRYYGYNFSTRQISQEYTETEQYHNNYVHPGSSGYQQIGDSLLAAYVAVLTE